MQWIQDLFEWAQQGLFESAVQPIMYSFGLGQVLEAGYTATGWLLVGLIQIAVMLALIGPLQRWRPVEPMLDAGSIRKLSANEEKAPSRGRRGRGQR